jgi:predicted Zn-dependent protease
MLSGCALGAWSVWQRVEMNPDRIRQGSEADLRSGRYERAATALARLRRPTVQDIILSAQAAMALGHFDEALTGLSQIPNSDPVAPQARLLAGQIHLRRDRLRLAEKSLLEAVKPDPALVQAHRQLVYIYGMLLRRRELNEHFQALSRLAPMTFDNVFHWCLTRNTVWEPHERLEDLRRYVAADPDDRWSRVALAETLRQVGRRAEAATVVWALPDSDPDARCIRARIALDRGDDRAFQAIMAGAGTDHPELTLLQGRFALAHGDGPTALRLFRMA